MSDTNNDPRRFLDISKQRGDKEMVRELLLRGMEHYQKAQLSTKQQQMPGEPKDERYA